MDYNQKEKTMPASDGSAVVRKKRDRRSVTVYLVKIAVLSALSVVLYLFARFPIFPPPFNVLDMDFSAIPSLLGGFALGPVAAIIIEVVKVGIKMATLGSTSAFVGELSNLIVSLSFVLPATFFYKYRKTRKGAIIGMVIGVLSNALLSSLSNYFLIVPMYAKLYSPAIMEVRVEFAFEFGLAFNLIKTVTSSVLTFLLYKRLSPLLHR